MFPRITQGFNNLITITVAMVGLAQAAGVWAQAAPTKTLADLQSAYDGESNAHGKYLEFAKQADGYGKVGSLSRAAAPAEQIHLTCEAAVLKKMVAAPEESMTK